jgi:hypothetical protein
MDRKLVCCIMFPRWGAEEDTLPVLRVQQVMTLEPFTIHVPTLGGAGDLHVLQLHRQTRPERLHARATCSERLSSDDEFQDTSARYRAVEPEQWLQRHPEAGSSWPSWPMALYSLK